MEKTADKKTGNADDAKKVLSKQLNANTGDIDELEVVDPVPEIVEIAGRKYEIKPLPLKKIKLILKLTKLQNKLYSEETIDEVVESVAQILGEKDTDFISDNVDVKTIGRIFAAVAKVNFRGVPIQKKKEMTSDTQNSKSET